MTLRRLAFFALLAVTLIDYAILVIWGGGALGAQSGGAPPFDLRATGYSLAEAQAFLTALTAEGLRLYLGPIRVLDTIFPVGCTLVLAIALWHRSLGLPGAARAALVALAAGYGAADLAENAAVAGLLRAGPQAVTAGQVATASALTVVKFVLFGLALVALVVLLFRRRPVPV